MYDLLERVLQPVVASFPARRSISATTLRARGADAHDAVEAVPIAIAPAVHGLKLSLVS
jgi:hypothetical protein